MMNKLMAGELEVLVHNLTEMEKQKFLSLFENFVKAKLVLEDSEGEHEIEIVAILNNNVKALDPYDHYEIFDESELLPQ